MTPTVTHTERQGHLCDGAGGPARATRLRGRGNHHHDARGQPPTLRLLRFKVNRRKPAESSARTHALPGRLVPGESPLEMQRGPRDRVCDEDE
eukprot:3934134-Rhodomonas_salina.1